MTEITLLGPGDEARLRNVLPGVFDLPLRDSLVREFLHDSRHHLAVALDDDRVIGIASAVHYLHPDKDPELWINEVAVAPEYRGRGLGKRLIQALLQLAGELGCREAWVLTEADNNAAQALYASAGGVRSDVDPVAFAFEIGP